MNHILIETQFKKIKNKGFIKSGGGSWIWTMEPEGTDLQSAAFDHFANPP